MRLAVLRCALLLLMGMCALPCARLWAQTPNASANKGAFSIAGVVVNAKTGEPIRQARVSVLSTEDSHAIESGLSDNEGRFILDRLPAAKYQLTASKRGFRTGYYDEHAEFSSAIVTGPDQDTTHLTFQLTPGGVIRGVITADGGDPVEGARVMLFKHPQHPGPGEHTIQADGSVSDDAGEYEFSNVAPGEYYVAVAAEPWYALHGEAGPRRNKQTNPALDVAYPVTFFDSTGDESAATPITVAGGSREEANISLHAVPAVHLSLPGGVKSNGSPQRAELQQTVFGTVVSTESAGFLDSAQSGTVEMGGIAPGHYQLTQGEPPRIVELDLSSSQQIDASAGSAASSVEGSLALASGQPVPDGAYVTLNRSDNGRGLNQFVSVAHNGQFEFEGVPQGTWSLWVASGNKMLPIVAIYSGREQQAGNLITVHEQPVNVRVSLAEGNTRVEGVARKQGKGFAGAMIVLAPRSASAWQSLMRRDQSDSDGSFALRDVAPGQYTVVAIEDGWALDWSRPEAMGRYLAQGLSINIAQNSGSVVRLDAPVPVVPR